MDTRYHISWGDWMTEEENQVRDYYLNLPHEEWKEVAEYMIRDGAWAWVQRIQRMRVARAEAKAQEKPREARSPLDITFGAWKDMIEEPWKYGDNDWAEWLEMDELLRKSPKRWRVFAFWQKKQNEADEKSRKAFIQMLMDAKAKFNNRMATRIQAAWRGHQVRDTHPQFNCARCLARVPCRTLDNGVYICSACVPPDDEEEQFDNGADYELARMLQRRW